MVFNPRTLKERLEEERKMVEERDAERRARKLGYPYLNLISVRVPTELKAMREIKEEEAREAGLVPLQLVKKMLVVAVFDPAKDETAKLIEKLEEEFEVKIVVVSKRSLEHALSYYQYIKADQKEISGRVGIDDTRLKDIQGQVRSLKDFSKLISGFKSEYISQLLEVILGGALALEASDIHLEATRRGGVLRVRLDGLLHTVFSDFKPLAYRSLLTRIKLLSRLKINVTDEPQDGRFTIDLEDRDIEIRTSVVPSEYGETAVLRVLDPRSLKADLRELGFRKDELRIVEEELLRPNGLILNTGPTGSGKTTTLYAFLRKVYSPEVKIITIEDPIEYHLQGISQTQVDAEANYTFASGLRSILRQDPDVILVGEIRDSETADIALNAALTGHLVFSTLHTNDAIGTVPRLFELGAKPNIVGPAVTLVIAQRLVRLLCQSCKELVKLSSKEEKAIRLFSESLPERAGRDEFLEFKVYKAKGCAACRNLGFKGRIGIFELFRVSREIESLIYKTPTQAEVFQLARKQGLVTMQEDGILKVLKGLTSFGEVIRMTGPILWWRKSQT